MAVDGAVTKYAAGMATVAAIVGLGALLKKSAYAGGTLPPELTELIMAMAADLSTINTVRLADILEAINTMTMNVQGFAPNANTISSFRTSFPIANVGVQMGDLVVPEDMALFVKSDPGNPAFPGVLRIGGTKAESENANSSYPIITNEFRTMRVKNASEIWVSASIVPAWVICSTERRF